MYEVNENASFEAYCRYLAMKNHFLGRGNYHRNNGLANVKKETFSKRRDRYMFHKLSKKADIEDRLLACLSHDPKMYVKKITESDEANQLTKSMLKRRNSLSYTFETDLKEIDDDGEIGDALVVKNGQSPLAVRQALSGQICIETLIVLDALTHVFEYWDKEISDPLIWPSLSKRCLQFRPFMSFDLGAMKKVYRKVSA